MIDRIATNETPSGTISAPASTKSDAVAGGRSKPDFTNMTPHQFSNAAQSMFDRGDISLDQLFKMQTATGTFGQTPTDDLKSQIPVNYVDYFNGQLVGIASRGGMGDERSGYQDVQKIIELISL